MTAHDGRDFDSRRYSLEHRVSWPDVWAGLLLMLFVGASAAVAVVLSSDGQSKLVKSDHRSAHEPHALTGVHDPRRIGWRATNGPWDATGSPEAVPAHDDRVG